MSAELYKKYRVLWLQPVKDGRFVGGDRTHCCEDLRQATTFECDHHDDPFECGDYLLAYNLITDEYGLPIRDGGGSVLIIRHCPFCGTPLPASKADRWFEDVEALGFTNYSDENIPAAYKSDAWWRRDKKQDD